MFRNALKKIAYPILGNCLLFNSALSALSSPDLVLAANLHRVGPSDGSYYRALDPHLFEELLDLVSRRFDVVTFADLNEPGDRPKFVFSFDDGYHDFLTFALPMLESRGLSSNMNIIPACVHSGRPPINVMVQDYLGKAVACEYSLADFPLAFGNSPPTESDAKRLSRSIKFRPIAERDELEHRILDYFTKIGFSDFTPVMSLSEIRSLPATVQIGAHSWEHASMSFESMEYFTQDLEKCKSFFRNKLSLSLDTYAFPNGSCTSEQIDVCRSAGITHVLTVNEGPSSSFSPHSRFNFDAKSASEVRYRTLHSGLRILP